MEKEKINLVSVLTESDLKKCILNAPLLYADGEPENESNKNPMLISYAIKSTFYRSKRSATFEFYKPISKC
jgi:hypothetical protein